MQLLRSKKAVYCLLDLVTKYVFKLTRVKVGTVEKDSDGTKICSSCRIILVVLRGVQKETSFKLLFSCFLFVFKNIHGTGLTWTIYTISFQFARQKEH